MTQQPRGASPRRKALRIEAAATQGPPCPALRLLCSCPEGEAGTRVPGRELGTGRTAPATGGLVTLTNLDLHNLDSASDICLPVP